VSSIASDTGIDGGGPWIKISKTKTLVTAIGLALPKKNAGDLRECDCDYGGDLVQGAELRKTPTTS
jgi:hypothetical protein